MIEFTTASGATYRIHIVVSVLFIVLTYIVVSLIKGRRLNKLLQQFRQGETDRAFIARCEKEITIYRGKGNTKPFNMLCVILCASYLREGDVESFLKWFNTLKPSGAEAEYMINVLLIQFFTETFYMDIVPHYPKDVRDDERSLLREVIEMYKCDFSDYKTKAEMLENSIDNAFVKENLHAFVRLCNGNAVE